MIKSKFTIIILIFLIALISGILIGTVNDIKFLKKELNYWQLLYSRQLQKTKSGPFINGYTDIPKTNMYHELRNQYISSKTNFITIDLRDMEMILFKEGEEYKSIKIVSKGKEGSFRETPSGNYYVMLKMSNKFSSVSKVWMPWSVQFYGNYFIHGMPYYSNGNLVSTQYSWGCIRLANEDAKEVFNFVEKGTPILITDDIDPLFTKNPNDLVNSLPVPDISAKSFEIFDYSSNEQLLKKEDEKVFPIGHLTKLITSLVSSEISNLEDYIIFNNQRYLALDILSIAFGESNNANAAAKSLVSLLGNKEFMKNAQLKIEALMLESTNILEPIGSDNVNKSSVADLTKLMGYLLEKRKIILHQSKESPEAVFVNKKGFYGGMTTNTNKDSVTAWELTNSIKEKYMIGITILDSKDAERDTNKLLDWVKNSYGLDN